MIQLLRADMDVIIDRYWPRTRSRTGLYKMMQETADMTFQKLLEYEATQEPVSNYRMSAPIPDILMAVGTHVSDNNITVAVHFKKGDHIYIAYCKNHVLNGDTIGSTTVPMEIFPK